MSDYFPSEHDATPPQTGAIPSVSGSAPVDFKKQRRFRAARVNSAIDRLPPRNIEAEQALLGCVMLAPNDCIPEVAAKFKGKSEPFYDLRHQTIWDELLSMHTDGLPVDVITLQSRLKDKQVLEQVGGIAYLAGLPELTPSAANLSYYLELIYEKYLLRRMINTCTDVVGRVYEYEGDVDTLMDEVERDVLAIAREKIIVVERSAKDAARDALLRMEVRHQSEGKPTGICTGLVDLDALTSGFQETEFTIIAGRPSDGKSSLASQIAEHIAVELRIPTQIFSLEMSDTLQMERMLSSRAKVNLRKPFLQRDFDNISHASAKISNSPLYFVDRPGISIAEIKNLVRNAVNKHGVKVVVVDYIGLVSAGGQKDSRTLEIGAITSGLKQLAMELKIHVIGISQLNRGNVQDGKNRKPVLSDLRESGNLEQDADNVLLIWNPNKKDEEEEQQWQSDAPYEVRLIIAKQRNGPRNVSVRLLFLPGFTRFETMSRVDDADVPSRVT